MSTYYVKKYTDLAVEGAAAGSAFLGTTIALRGAMMVLRIHAATPVLSTVAGAATVIAGGIASMAAVKFLNQRDLSFRRSMLRKHEIVQAAVASLLVYKLLGGNFTAMCPSSLVNVGAFATKRGSLPATVNYASPEERAALLKLGELFGCHSCGQYAATKAYIADHQPPVKYAKEANSHLWRRATGLKLRQRFYPQCLDCSQLQSAAVRAGKTVFRFHWKTLRRYHGTGLALYALYCLNLGKDPKGVIADIARCF